MNRGVVQSSQLQEMGVMGNSNWWNIKNMTPPTVQYTSPVVSSPSVNYTPYPSASASSALPLATLYDSQEIPLTWSQLLMDGMQVQDDRISCNQIQTKKMENWEDLLLFPSSSIHVSDVKRDISNSSFDYDENNRKHQTIKSAWNYIMPVSSPRSNLATSSKESLDFSDGGSERKNHRSGPSSECNSATSGSSCKKARIQASPTQPPIKVRKEKLGDRITALHQLVSPYGKTDTASVLLEAIGYIRFLQSQIQALSTPYMGNRESVKKSENDGGLKKDLRSRGLCLVPVSCTLLIGGDIGADYWAPAPGVGFYES